MLDHSVTKHLRKYFDLARSRFADGDPALAAFFAITLIEECAKILYLRDANIEDREEVRQGALDHSQKYFSAVVNLLSGTDRFDALPKQWQNLMWFLSDPKEFRRLRNDSLYLRFNKRGTLTTPAQAIADDRAAILVYMAGFAAAELREYIELEASWADSILQAAEAFRAKYLR